MLNRLLGYENGVLMSVEGQINQLIQTAMDSQYLSIIFCGWRPYM